MSEREKIQQTEQASQTSSYRSIFKATSLFGGVQVYQILIEIIKSKLIAVLLGPLGVGIQGLYTSATNLIQQLTSFGLSSSAVRNVAEANATGDEDKVGRVISALQRLVWLTGLLGMVGVILFSPLLSKTSFGESSHIIPFVILSVTLLLNQLSAGQRVVLQGTRQLKLLAKSTTIGVTAGLIVCIPLYYLLGLNGIVPNLIFSSVIALSLTTYYSKKINIKKTILTNKEVFILGRSMLVMGIALSLSHLLASASSYIVRAFIRSVDGVEAVGLYTAGFVLMNHYTGLVFSAMGTDYFPRLSSVNQDNIKCRDLMNQQGEIGLLIIAPLMVLCIVFIPLIVKLLYSESFLPINSFIIWCSLGMLFKMSSWAISYVFVAKAESKLFFINEFASALYTLCLNLIGYKIGGLEGVGITYALSYLVYMFQVYFIARNKYDFSFTKEFLKIFAVCLILLVISVVCFLAFSPILRYSLGTVLLLLSGVYSLCELNRRVCLIDLVKKLKKK